MLTLLSVHAFKSTSLRYDLPCLNLALMTTTKFLQTLLGEPSQTVKGAEIDFACCQDNDALCVSLAGLAVRSIVYHVFLDECERTQLVCNFGDQALEDRKADEFTPGLKLLLALLFVNDEPFEHSAVRHYTTKYYE